ncbi:MAG: FtsX-like permease family protein [Bacteroidota bacterium]
MIWKTAWKNVWRNKVRSLVVISSVTIGIFAGVFSVALMNGLIAQRVDDALNEEISHIQITGKDFLINNDPRLVIRNPEETLSRIRSANGVDAISERTVITGMANTATKSAGVQIIGIDPEKEKHVFTLSKKIMPGTGDYFEKESKFNLALIGQELAKDLNIIRYSIDTSTLSGLKEKGVPENIISKLIPLAGKRFANEKKFIKEMKTIFSSGESMKYGLLIRQEAWSFREGARLTLTFLDTDNNQVGAVFRLTGLYDLANSMYEKSTVFVRNTDLKKLTGIPGDDFHQLVVKIGSLDQTDALTTKLAEKLPELEVMSWKKIQPDLAMMTDMVGQFYLIFGLIILAALAFGIINTMLMVVMERTRELGMLTAIGMNKKKVFSMIMLESVFLSLIGGVTGMITSYILIRITSNTGINLSKYTEGFEALGYSAKVYPQISAGFFGGVTILIIITGVLSSIYPALKALKLNPVEAIRAE